MIELSVRIELHTEQCLRCLEPRPSGAPCTSCTLEDVMIGALRNGPSLERYVAQVEHDRDQRRAENA